MDPETSTAALAVTVKPAVDPKIAIAVGATILVGAFAAGVVYKLRKDKKNAAETPAVSDDFQ